MEYLLVSGHICFDILIFFLIACILEKSPHNNDSLKTVKVPEELQFIILIRKLRINVPQTVLLALIYVLQLLAPLADRVNELFYNVQYVRAPELD